MRAAAEKRDERELHALLGYGGSIFRLPSENTRRIDLQLRAFPHKTCELLHARCWQPHSSTTRAT
eukprot:scaffold26809_cov63-Phaeocystis_antarctica.AAC.1